MRGDKSAPIGRYPSPEPERPMGRSLQCYILTGCALYRGVIRRERPACRPAPHSPTGREAASSKAYLQNYSKTSPTSTRTNLSEPNFLPAWAGARGGSSGRMREVWREKRRFCKAKSADSGFAALNSPPKGGPFSLQGLFSSIQAYTTGGDEDEGKD